MVNQKKARRLLKLRRFVRGSQNTFKLLSWGIIKCRKTLRISILSALLLIFLSYLVDSSPYPLGGEVSTSQWIERIKRVFHSDSVDNVPDSILLINVAYDKVLMDYNARLYSGRGSSPTLPAGHIPTTDRNKLFKFLSVADSLSNYKFIIIDIRFEDDIEYDSISKKLFNLIGRMKNITFAIHETCSTTEEAPHNKAAFADYHTTFLVTDIVKYPLLKRANNNAIFRESIPARVFSELNNGQFSTYGIFTFYNDYLCRRAIYPTFPVRLTSWAKESDNTHLPETQYKNLGEDILTHPKYDEYITTIINEKIVVIGDLVDDIHDTYVGPQPGALINLNTYISLCNGDHLVNWIAVVFQFILYSGLTFCILKHIILVDKFRFLQLTRVGVLSFIISFFGYSAILTIASFFAYIFFGTIFSIALPTIYFSFLESCTK